MQDRSIVVGIAIGALLFAARAVEAGPPGAANLLCQSANIVKFVRENAPPNGVRDAGEDTACANPVVDDTPPPPFTDPVIRDGGTLDTDPICVQKTLGQLRGTLSLMIDDTAVDNDGVDEFVTVSALLELLHGGDVLVVADTFAAPKDAFDPFAEAVIGHWNTNGSFTSEAQVFDAGWRGAYFLSGGSDNVTGLDTIRTRLQGLAQSLGLDQNEQGQSVPVEPILARADRDGPRKNFAATAGACDGGCGALESDETASALASVARYRLTISFAEAGSPTTPCS